MQDSHNFWWSQNDRQGFQNRLLAAVVYAVALRWRPLRRALWHFGLKLSAREIGGADFDPPTLTWLTDVIRADRFIAREIEKAGEKRAAELRKQVAQQRRNQKGRRR